MCTYLYIYIHIHIHIYIYYTYVQLSRSKKIAFFALTRGSEQHWCWKKKKLRWRIVKFGHVRQTHKAHMPKRPTCMPSRNQTWQAGKSTRFMGVSKLDNPTINSGHFPLLCLMKPEGMTHVGFKSQSLGPSQHEWFMVMIHIIHIYGDEYDLWWIFPI